MHSDGRLRVGLTGGIGSGKSTVAVLLARHGAAVIDTDAIARHLASPGGAAIAAIRDVFGAEFIDSSGALDRARMRTLAFSDATARQRLESILHPLIGTETERQAAASTATVLVFDVPLLAESTTWRSRVDRVLVVDCSAPSQIERVIARSAWPRGAVEAVIAQQAERSTRRAIADAVIFNDGIGLEELTLHVQALASSWFPESG